jgi:phage terminase large subunit
VFEASILYEVNYNSTANKVVNQGGTSSGKTYAIIQALFTKLAEKKGKVATVVGQDIPNLKSGALRDALDIYSGSEILQRLIKSYNRTDRIFEFRNGSLIEFKSYDSPQDAKSGKRDYLFINEANGIPVTIYNELSLRTKEQEFLDYNPNTHFWVHDEVLGSSDAQLFISDHRHNPFCPDKLREKIEGLKQKDEELWKVYARGLTGKIEGLIFRNWDLVDDIPKDAKFIAAGMDYGFTNDVTSAVEVYMQNGELYLNEIVYQNDLTNQQIGQKLDILGFDRKNTLIPDSSEPKSNKELSELGFKVEPAEKGPDSVLASIDILKRYKMNITRNSLNLRKELNNYKWKVDKLTNTTLNEPVDAFNHAIDAVRYVALNKLKINQPSKTKFSVHRYSQPSKPIR